MPDSNDNKLTHFNEQGRARMVDVSNKDITLRTALACCTVRLSPETFMLVRDGKMKKGDVLAVAQVAGIMAAKKNSELIPMCHPIALTGVDIDFELNEADSSILITSSVRCKGETGVEMEALTAASVAALTVYDMCKAVQKDIVIDNLHLLKKTGGKSGDYVYKGE